MVHNYLIMIWKENLALGYEVHEIVSCKVCENAIGNLTTIVWELT